MWLTGQIEKRNLTTLNWLCAMFKYQWFCPGLPDGISSNRKSQFRCILYIGSCSGRCWYIYWPFGLFYGHLVYFVAIGYILWPLGTYIFPFLVCRTKTNLATLTLTNLEWILRHSSTKFMD
jgi:hypothetical protein